jgi:hypothetical protein
MLGSTRKDEGPSNSAACGKDEKRRTDFSWLFSSRRQAQFCVRINPWSF